MTKMPARRVARRPPIPPTVTVRLLRFKSSGLAQVHIAWRIGLTTREWHSKITAEEKALILAGDWLGERYSVTVSDLVVEIVRCA